MGWGEFEMIIISRKDAITQGLKRFFTGKPCKDGHISERQISDYKCLECSRIKAKKRREADPEGERENQKRYREKNKEKINARNRERYRADPERYRAYAMKYYWDNWEKCRQWRKDWWQKDNENKRFSQRNSYKENPDMFLSSSKKWKDENREYVRSYCNGRRHIRDDRIKNATPKWADDKSIAEIHALRARLQDERGIRLEVDHYYPLQGEKVCGLNVPNNLQIITYEENRSKGNKMPEDFYGANHQMKGI